MHPGTNLSRTRENNCPLAQNPQKIPIQQSINTVQAKTLRTWEKTLPFGIQTVRTGRSSLPMLPFGQ
jgi:hypothetical protein